jgi:hypothetical protein
MLLAANQITIDEYSHPVDSEKAAILMSRTAAEV